MAHVMAAIDAAGTPNKIQSGIAATLELVMVLDA